jgi:uncharacterized circularly permuted ATP-grasp superfamily protein
MVAALQIINNSSLAEYAEWYLTRENLKSGKKNDLSKAVIIMEREHQGKLPLFYKEACWEKVLIDKVEEFENLIFLEANPGWTYDEHLVLLEQGLNYRLLKNVAQNAIANDYLHTGSNPQKHLAYYENFQNGKIQLSGMNRIFIHTANSDIVRKNPKGEYYIQDGSGRCLALMILLLEKKPSLTVGVYDFDGAGLF